MDTSHVQENSPTAFFALTLLLSAPLYVLNALAFMGVLGSPEMGPVYIVLLTFTPGAAAVLLTLRSRGKGAVKTLLLRVFDFRRIEDKRWYMPVFLLGPLIFALSVGVAAALADTLPGPDLPVWVLPAAFAFFLLLAAGEEVGWMGYAAEPLQVRYGALGMALVLGAIWSLWHLPFFIFLFPDPIIIGAQLLTLVGARVLLVWIFNNTGKSLCAVTIYHAADNAGFMTLPNIVSDFPLGAVVHCGLTLSAACLVVLLWRSATLTRLRFRAHPGPDAE